MTIRRLPRRPFGEQVFTASGTWTPPYLPMEVEVIVVGGGGGAESGNSNATATSAAGGDGGGGGAVIRAEHVYLDETTGAVTVTVGAGGTGGAVTSTTTKNTGAKGGDSSFGTFVTGWGGSGGGLPGSLLSQYVTATYRAWGGDSTDPPHTSGNGWGGAGGSEGREGTISNAHGQGIGASLTVTPASPAGHMFGGVSTTASSSVNQTPGRGTNGYGGGGAGGAGGSVDVPANRVAWDGGGAAGAAGANGSSGTANTGGGGGGGGRTTTSNGAAGSGGNGGSGLVIVRWVQRVSS